MGVDVPEQDGGGTEAIDFVYGLNPVLAVLEDEQRPLESVAVLKGGHGNRLQEVIDRARQRGLRPRFVDRATLDRLSGHGA
ncbi:MAG: hypothetical protein HQL88_00420, partial [Magnetococcales bacterium]|nr:hypothetical protein [Magnetococcales bacterium]